MRGIVKLVLICGLFLNTPFVFADDGEQKNNAPLKNVNSRGGNLKASVLHDQVYLYWTFGDDFGSFSMVLEHSVDGLLWEEIITDVKDMHAQVGHKFQFVDKRRCLGRNYYRVKVDLGSETIYSSIGDVFLNKCDGPLALRSYSKYSFSFSIDKSAGALTENVSLLDVHGEPLGYTLQENKGVYTIRIEEGKELTGDYTLKICTEKGLYTSHIHVN